VFRRDSGNIPVGFQAVLVGDERDSSGFHDAFTLAVTIGRRRKASDDTAIGRISAIFYIRNTARFPPSASAIPTITPERFPSVRDSAERNSILVYQLHSHSMDDAGTTNQRNYGTSLILNPRSASEIIMLNSDFDVRHNYRTVWQSSGRVRRWLLSDADKVVDCILRRMSGCPASFAAGTADLFAVL